MKVNKIDTFNGAVEILASDHFTSQTGTATTAMGKDVDGRKVVKAGTVYPKNDATAKGIVVTSVDVTDGPQPVAYMDHGSVYENRLPEAVSEAAKTALKNIFFRKYE